MQLPDDRIAPPSQPETSDDAQPPTLDDVYADRNLLAQLAAALADRLGMRVGRGVDPNEPDWPVVYIDLPSGQVSWHVPQPELVVELDHYLGKWDGHSVEEKQRRIRAFLAQATDRD